MSAELVCLTLIAARSLRDELFDYLNEQRDLVSGFTGSGRRCLLAVNSQPAAARLRKIGRMHPLHREAHLIERIGWLRAAVLGANDGIISTARFPAKASTTIMRAQPADLFHWRSTQNRNLAAHALRATSVLPSSSTTMRLTMQIRLFKQCKSGQRQL